MNNVSIHKIYNTILKIHIVITKLTKTIESIETCDNDYNKNKIYDAINNSLLKSNYYIKNPIVIIQNMSLLQILHYERNKRTNLFWYNINNNIIDWATMEVFYITEMSQEYQNQCIKYKEYFNEEHIILDNLNNDAMGYKLKMLRFYINNVMIPELN